MQDSFHFAMLRDRERVHEPEILAGSALGEGVSTIFRIGHAAERKLRLVHRAWYSCDRQHIRMQSLADLIDEEFRSVDFVAYGRFGQVE